jgi:hypothetical protein
MRQRGGGGRVDLHARAGQREEDALGAEDELDAPAS